METGPRSNQSRLSPQAQEAIAKAYRPGNAERWERAAKEAGLIPTPVVGWQPIETAPKDRSTMLLFEPDELNIFVGYWCGPQHGWLPLSSSRETEPTHWMPLPEPPR